jgi:hypothetical protein
LRSRPPLVPPKEGNSSTIRKFLSFGEARRGLQTVKKNSIKFYKKALVSNVSKITEYEPRGCHRKNVTQDPYKISSTQHFFFANNTL